jgi:hypothetical protein
VTLALRDELEAVLRGWDAYERSRDALPIVDFDFRPDPAEQIPVHSRLEALSRCGDILARAEGAGNRHIARRAQADVTYLRALLGERLPLGDYLRLTQGSDAFVWPEPYLSARRDQAEAALDRLGIAWGPSTADDLRQHQGPISVEEAELHIRKAADEFEEAVRRITGSTARFDLAVETADVDAYWGYWLDGAGSDVRLRLNLRRARFTPVRARQFALHEVLGHGLQCASIARRCSENDVPWVRLQSVHCPQEIASEGLAQALPLLVAPEDEELMTCVRLDHYLQLVRGNLHLAINRGDSIEACARYAKEHVPFWDGENISDLLADRSTNPLLRSYLWAYPAGFDWFVNLAEHHGPSSKVLTAAYREPLAPVDLAGLWSPGPEPGSLRQESIPAPGSHRWPPAAR